MKPDKRQKLLLVVALAAVALFLGDKLVLSPLTNYWKASGREIASLRERVANGTMLIRHETALRGLWDEMRTNTLPANPSLAQEQLLHAIEDWSRESSVSLNGVTPQRRTDSQEFETLVCRVDVSGSLWTLVRFLYDIENSPMALKIESVDLSSRDNTGQQLTLGLQVNGLILGAKGETR